MQLQVGRAIIDRGLDRAILLDFLGVAKSSSCNLFGLFKDAGGIFVSSSPSVIAKCGAEPASKANIGSLKACTNSGLVIWFGNTYWTQQASSRFGSMVDATAARVSLQLYSM